MTTSDQEEEITMKTRAAVAMEKGKPLIVTEVDLDGPKAGDPRARDDDLFERNRQR